MTEIVGWLGFMFVLLGYYFNAKRKIYCFYIWGLGNILFLIYGFLIDARPQMAICLFVILMNIYGYRQWSKEE
jgi:nicotinamide riboside transporter PnuC